MNFRTLSVLLSTVSLASVASSTARGDDSKRICTDAYAQAQTLRDAHKLKDAREQLRVCSQSTCKAFIVKDCTDWLLDVESRLPSVVFSAKDSRGQPLTDVTVSMDGATVAEKLDGESIEVDPGQHTFTFVASDGTKVEQPFAVLEGQKAQSVLASVPTAASIAAMKAEQEAAQPPAPAPAPPPPPEFWTTRRKIAVAVGGVGVAGIVTGGIFGLLATSAASQQKTDCAGPTTCSNRGQALSDHSSALNDSTISTVAFIAGGAVLAGGVALFLFGGKGAESPAVSSALLVVPTLGPSGGGLLMRKGF